MPTHRDDRTEKPSVIDLVTDPEKFDDWQRQRRREEAGNRPSDNGRERSPRTDEPRGGPVDR